MHDYFFLKIDEEILVIMFVSHWCLICSCTHAFHQNTSRCQNIFLVVILIKINSFYYVLLNFCNINYEKKKIRNAENVNNRICYGLKEVGRVRGGP